MLAAQLPRLPWLRLGARVHQCWGRHLLAPASPLPNNWAPHTLRRPHSGAAQLKGGGILPASAPAPAAASTLQAGIPAARRCVHTAASAAASGGEPTQDAGSPEGASAKAVAGRRRRASPKASVEPPQGSEQQQPEKAPQRSRRRSLKAATPSSDSSSSSSSSSSTAVGLQEQPATQEGTGGTGSAQGPGGDHLLILDAMAVLYRAHFASFGPAGRLTNSLGEDTTVLYRFFRTLFALVEGPPPPSHLVVVLDSGGPTFRSEIDPGYKAHREACPIEVSAAANRLKWLLPKLGVPVVRESGWEADDIIGTLAVRAVEGGLPVSIASPDKDFLQLLRPGLVLLKMPTATMGRAKYQAPPYTHLDFEQDYGVPPAQYAEVLALAGDQADGIPGLRNIGEKTALSLLRKFGSLRGALEGAEQVKRKNVQAALTAPGAAELALSCLEMATIRCDVGTPQTQLAPEHWRLRVPAPEDAAEAEKEFEVLEFKSLIDPLKAHLERLGRVAAGSPEA